MSTVADYVSRQADILAFRGTLPLFRQKEQLLLQSLVFPTDGGALIAGIEKLAQKVLLILFTKIGSRKYAPTEGTSFMIDAQRGYWRTPSDVEASFYTARLDISRQCRNSEADTDPLDERWASLDLTGVILVDDQVTVRLSLTSAAGNAYEFLTPITVSNTRSTDGRVTTS